MDVMMTVSTEMPNGVGFIAYARRYVGRLQAEGRYDAAHKMGTYISRFAAYLGKNDISFTDFGPMLIRNYHAWLQDRRLGQNSISLYIRNLKRVYRQAVKDGQAAEQHPFDGVDVSYRVKKDKNGLTLDEVRRLQRLDLSGSHPSLSFARDLFLFSVFTHGMTARDMFYLTEDNISGGRLTYTSRTTGKEVSMQWEPAMQEIVDRYSSNAAPYLFPVITSSAPKEQWKQHCAALHNINRNLKTIGRQLSLPFPLTMTVAHHSWESMTRSMSVAQLL